MRQNEETVHDAGYLPTRMCFLSAKELSVVSLTDWNFEIA